jgi:hypothetical protein
MEKAYNITNIKIEKDYLVITVNDQTIKLKLASISDKLAKATEAERAEFSISPSGYGIHWRLLDEDLSINGLLKTAKLKHIMI